MSAGFPIVPGGVQVLHAEITPGETVLDPRPTSLWVEGEGSFTMMDDEGNQVTYNVNGGTLFPFSPAAITETETVTGGAPVRVIGWGRAVA